MPVTARGACSFRPRCLESAFGSLGRPTSVSPGPEQGQAHGRSDWRHTGPACAFRAGVPRLLPRHTASCGDSALLCCFLCHPPGSGSIFHLTPNRATWSWDFSWGPSGRLGAEFGPVSTRGGHMMAHRSPHLSLWCEWACAQRALAESRACSPTMVLTPCSHFSTPMLLWPHFLACFFHPLYILLKLSSLLSVIGESINRA